MNAILTVVGIMAQKCIIRNGEGRYFPQTLHFVMLILKTTGCSIRGSTNVSYVLVLYTCYIVSMVTYYFMRITQTCPVIEI